METIKTATFRLDRKTPTDVSNASPHGKNQGLHYCVMDCEFAGLDPSLPKSVTVTAYPWRESLTLPSATKIGKPL
jgi:hypothetical protein